MCFKSKESRAQSRPPARVCFFPLKAREGGGSCIPQVAWPGRPTAVCPDAWMDALTHLGQVALRHGWRVSRAAAGPGAPSRRPHRRHRTHRSRAAHTHTHSRRGDALTRAGDPLATSRTRLPETEKRYSEMARLARPATCTCRRYRPRRANRPRSTPLRQVAEGAESFL